MHCGCRHICMWNTQFVMIVLLLARGNCLSTGSQGKQGSCCESPFWVTLDFKRKSYVFSKVTEDDLCLFSRAHLYFIYILYGESFTVIKMRICAIFIQIFKHLIGVANILEIWLRRLRKIQDYKLTINNQNKWTIRIFPKHSTVKWALNLRLINSQRKPKGPRKGQSFYICSM